MKKISAGTILKYVIAFAIGGIFSYFVIVVTGYKEVTDEVARLRILADCFTVPGVILIMVSAFCWLSSQGAVDGISYALGGLFRRLLPGAQYKEPEKYYDYVTRKREKRKGGYGFLAITGLVYLAVAIVFIIKFYQVY